MGVCMCENRGVSTQDAVLVIQILEMSGISTLFKSTSIVDSRYFTYVLLQSNLSLRLVQIQISRGLIKSQLLCGGTLACKCVCVDLAARTHLRCPFISSSVGETNLCL